MKTVIQFGAGNIGRGFIGNILSTNGYEVCFADINKNVIDSLNEKREYIVEVVGKECQDITIKNVRGVLSNSDEIYKEIKECFMITTAVGPVVLPIIAKTLAKGIELRMEAGIKESLNIIACENMIKGSSFLKEEVKKHISEAGQKYMDEYVGFPDSAVDRIVPPMEKSSDILKVRVEEFNEWIVDETQFKGEIPEICGMTLTDNLMAFIERKLFTLNTGHALTAYLGRLEGYKTIRESISDKQIKDQVIQAMKESGEVLIKRYNFNRESHLKYIRKIVSRFENPYLVDEVDRVGREPLRIIGYTDRLIKPLRGTLEFNTKNDSLVHGIAAAMAYRNENDPQAVTLRNKIESQDLKSVFREITSLTDSPDIEERVITEYQTL